MSHTGEPCDNDWEALACEELPVTKTTEQPMANPAGGEEPVTSGEVNLLPGVAGQPLSSQTGADDDDDEGWGDSEDEGEEEEEKEDAGASPTPSAAPAAPAAPVDPTSSAAPALNGAESDDEDGWGDLEDEGKEGAGAPLAASAAPVDPTSSSASASVPEPPSTEEPVVRTGAGNGAGAPDKESLYRALMGAFHEVLRKFGEEAFANIPNGNPQTEAGIFECIGMTGNVYRVYHEALCALYAVLKLAFDAAGEDVEFKIRVWAVQVRFGYELNYLVKSYLSKVMIVSKGQGNKDETRSAWEVFYKNGINGKGLSVINPNLLTAIQQPPGHWLGGFLNGLHNDNVNPAWQISVAVACAVFQRAISATRSAIANLVNEPETLLGHITRELDDLRDKYPDLSAVQKHFREIQDSARLLLTGKKATSPLKIALVNYFLQPVGCEAVIEQEGAEEDEATKPRLTVRPDPRWQPTVNNHVELVYQLYRRARSEEAGGQIDMAKLGELQSRSERTWQLRYNRGERIETDRIRFINELAQSPYFGLTWFNRLFDFTLTDSEKEARPIWERLRHLVDTYEESYAQLTDAIERCEKIDAQYKRARATQAVNGHDQLRATIAENTATLKRLKRELEDLESGHATILWDQLNLIGSRRKERRFYDGPFTPTPPKVVYIGPIEETESAETESAETEPAETNRVKHEDPRIAAIREIYGSAVADQGKTAGTDVSVEDLCKIFELPKPSEIKQVYYHDDLFSVLPAGKYPIPRTPPNERIYQYLFRLHAQQYYGEHQARNEPHLPPGMFAGVSSQERLFINPADNKIYLLPTPPAGSPEGTVENWRLSCVSELLSESLDGMLRAMDRYGYRGYRLPSEFGLELLPFCDVHDLAELDKFNREKTDPEKTDPEKLARSERFKAELVALFAFKLTFKRISTYFPTTPRFALYCAILQHLDPTFAPAEVMEAVQNPPKPDQIPQCTVPDSYVRGGKDVGDQLADLRGANPRGCEDGHSWVASVVVPPHIAAETTVDQLIQTIIDKLCAHHKYASTREIGGEVANEVIEGIRPIVREAATAYFSARAKRAADIAVIEAEYERALAAIDAEAKLAAAAAAAAPAKKPSFANFSLSRRKTPGDEAREAAKKKRDTELTKIETENELRGTFVRDIIPAIAEYNAAMHAKKITLFERYIAEQEAVERVTRRKAIEELDGKAAALLHVLFWKRHSYRVGHVGERNKTVDCLSTRLLFHENTHIASLKKRIAVLEVKIPADMAVLHLAEKPTEECEANLRRAEAARAQLEANRKAMIPELESAYRAFAEVVDIYVSAVRGLKIPDLRLDQSIETIRRILFKDPDESGITEEESRARKAAMDDVKRILELVSIDTKAIENEKKERAEKAEREEKEAKALAKRQAELKERMEAYSITAPGERSAALKGYLAGIVPGKRHQAPQRTAGAGAGASATDDNDDKLVVNFDDVVPRDHSERLDAMRRRANDANHELRDKREEEVAQINADLAASLSAAEANPTMGNIRAVDANVSKLENIVTELLAADGFVLEAPRVRQRAAPSAAPRPVAAPVRSAGAGGAAAPQHRGQPRGQARPDRPAPGAGAARAQPQSQRGEQPRAPRPAPAAGAARAQPQQPQPQRGQQPRAPRPAPAAAAASGVAAAAAAAAAEALAAADAAAAAVHKKGRSRK